MVSDGALSEPTKRGHTTADDFDLTARLRSLIPPLLVPRLVDERVRRRLRDPDGLREPREHMEFVVGAARPDVDIDDLARRYLHYELMRHELRWHPRMIKFSRLEGSEHLLAAQSEGRGAVISFMHHAGFEGLLRLYADHGAHTGMTAHPGLYYKRMHRNDRQHLKITTRGGYALNAAVGYQGIRSVVAQGGLIVSACDVPGSTPLRFVGRDVKGSSGGVRTAMDLGVPLLVSNTYQEADGRQFVRITRVDYDASDEVTEVLQRVVTRHEESILAWPEACDIPKTRWNFLSESP